jgi:hypothetical protein
MALNWLPGRKIDHPMANMKKAREMVDALPRGDSVRALEEAASWLSSINRETGFKLDYRLELLDMIDRGLKPHWHAIAPEYLDAPRLQKLYENRLWHAFFGYWRALADAYLYCLRQFQAGTAAGMDKELPRIVGRVLRSVAVQIKWRLLRYEIVEDRLWEDLGKTYLFAESRGFARTQAAIYPGAHGESSAQEEMLKALLLVMSSPDALTPAKIQIAERIVAQLARMGTMDTVQTAGNGFYFDLAMHVAPARVTRGLRTSSTVRYFGPGAGRKALGDMAQAINQKGSVPGDLFLGGDFDKQAVMSVLAHIARYWSEAPPERRTARLNLVTRLTIVPGFNEAVAWIDSESDRDSLEFLTPVQSESWVVANASDGGYGATVPTAKGDWLKVGAVVGLRAEGQATSRVGVLRRTHRDKDGQRRVGIEVLSKIAVPVRFSLAQGDKPAVPAGNSANALLLDNKPDANGRIRLLLRASSYLAGKAAQLLVRGKSYLLAPVAAVEEGDEFDLVTFKIVKPLG